MSGDYVYLQGSEDVQRAGVAIRNASETMSRVGNQTDEAFAAHMRFMTDWIERFENVVEKLISAVQGSRVPQLDATSVEGSRTGRIHNTSGNITEVERGGVPPVGFDGVVGKSRFEDETA